MRQKILIVEDDPVQADVLAHLLEARGYFVDVVDNGREAVRRLRGGLFDVAIIDFHIPEFDGSRVALVVRNLVGLAKRPRLIALTSSPANLSANAAEFDAILAKPLAAEALVRAIEQGGAVDPAPACVLSASATPAGLDEACLPQETDLLNGRGASRGRVLLADDDPHMLELVRLTLESDQMDVDVAGDGLEAVRMIEAGSYDVVVVDFQMPRLDGLAAAKVIYDSVGREVRPRIVALTSTPESIMAQDPAWTMVLDGIVSKRGGPAAVLRMVQDCLYYKALRTDRPIEMLSIGDLANLASSLALPTVAG